MYLIKLTQADTAGDIPPFWKNLVIAKKQHQLTVLQLSLDNTSLLLRIRAPMVDSPALLCIVVSLTFRLDYKDDLTTSLHPFVIGHHTYAIRKALHTCYDHYNIATDRTGTKLADKLQMIIPNCVALPTTLSMYQENLACTCLVLNTFLSH